MTDDLKELLALAVAIANLVVTGQHSDDAKVISEARAALDQAFGSLVAQKD